MIVYPTQKRELPARIKIDMSLTPDTNPFFIESTFKFADNIPTVGVPQEVKYQKARMVGIKVRNGFLHTKSINLPVSKF